MDPLVMRLAGLADCCELASLIWTFPDRALAGAVADGSCASDATACLADAGADDLAVEKVGRAFAALGIEEAGAAYEQLRLEHSRLFLAAGARPRVYLYEGPFKHDAAGKEGLPGLFGTATVHAVKDCMRAAGVVPADAEEEPVDSIMNEFAYLSYLYGSLARDEGKALDDPSFDEFGAERIAWSGHIRAIVGPHVSTWVADFADRVESQAGELGMSGVYPAFALFTREVLALVEKDVAQRA